MSQPYVLVSFALATPVSELCGFCTHSLSNQGWVLGPKKRQGRFRQEPCGIQWPWRTDEAVTPTRQLSEWFTANSMDGRIFQAPGQRC